MPAKLITEDGTEWEFDGLKPSGPSSRTLNDYGDLVEIVWAGKHESVYWFRPVPKRYRFANLILEETGEYLQVQGEVFYLSPSGTVRVWSDPNSWSLEQYRILKVVAVE